MSPMERAVEHHLNACLDNHKEADCEAVLLANELNFARVAAESAGSALLDVQEDSIRQGRQIAAVEAVIAIAESEGDYNPYANLRAALANPASVRL